MIFMNIEMPLLSGVDAARLIMDECPACKVIFITGHSEAVVSEFLSGMGGHDYILKPAPSKEIRKVLQKYIPVADSIKESEMCENININKIMEYIQSHLHSELNLDKLAEQVYLNRQYLSRLFKQETGYTITQYITNCRLEKAMYYLSHYSQDSIVEISEKCGFTDPNYFSRVFKKYVNTTPTQYQQKAQASHKKRMNTFNNFVM